MKKRLLCLALTLIMVFSLLPSAAFSAETAVKVTVAGMENYSYAAKVVQLVNDQRSENGEDSLSRNATLTELAMQRAAEIAIYYESNHLRPDDSQCSTVADGVYTGWTNYGENIAIGQLDPNEVMGDWMNSQGHRENILDSAYTQIGVGCFQADGIYCWVQIFGDSTSNTRTTNTTGSVITTRDISILPSNLNLSPTGTKSLELEEGESATFSIATTNPNFTNCAPVLVPQTEDVISGGTTIATVSASDDGTITVTAQSPGIGSAKITVYDGQTNPLTLTVTVPETQPTETEHTHSFTPEVTNPTCTKKGYTTYTCPCGDSYVESEVDELGHIYEEGVCTRCGEQDPSTTKPTEPEPTETEPQPTEPDPTEPSAPTEPKPTEPDPTEPSAPTEPKPTEPDPTEPPAPTEPKPTEPPATTEPKPTEPEETEHIHVEEIVGAYDPTCEDTGYTGDVYCSVCGEKLKTGQILDRHFGKWEVTAFPDGPHSSGDKRLTCTVCGETIETCVEGRENPHPNGHPITLLNDDTYGPVTLTITAADAGHNIFVSVPLNGDYVPDRAVVITESGKVIETTFYEVGCFHFVMPDEPVTVEVIFTYSPVHIVQVYSNPGGTVYASPDNVRAGDPFTLYVYPDEGYTLDQILYYTDDGSDLAYEWISENEIYVVMPASDLVFEIYFVLSDSPFVDVKESNYFYNPVLWAVSNGITSGIGNNRFGPSNPCTRAQVVTFLWRACGSPDPQNWNNPFTDVKESDYYYKAVLWAVENGITSGVSATRFGPGNPCTRAQVVTFLWRTAASPEPSSGHNPFADVKESDYYYKAVLWAVENGITSGVDATHFGPNNTCTRGQIVTFLYQGFHG